MSPLRTILLSFTIATVAASSAMAAKRIDLPLARVLNGIRAKTEIGENASEISQVDLGYVIKGGGALILCEGAGGTNGPKGGCASTDPASVSDLLAFIANGSNETLTLYSDPTLDHVNFDPAALKKAFGPTIAYVQEGWYYDERTGDYGLITGSKDLSVYIKKGKGFTRAFIIGSDTTEGVPEPASWALMISGVALAGWRLRRKPLPRAVAG